MTVYFIRSGDNGPVKIGVTSGDPAVRLRDLQTAHYETLRVIRAVAGGAAVEFGFHQMFRAHHIRGEWFRFDEAMLTALPVAARRQRVVTRIVDAPKWSDQYMMALRRRRFARVFADFERRASWHKRTGTPFRNHDSAPRVFVRKSMGVSFHGANAGTPAPNLSHIGKPSDADSQHGEAFR